MEGHSTYNVRPGEMKIWSLSIGGLSIALVSRAGLTVYLCIDVYTYCNT